MNVDSLLTKATELKLNNISCEIDSIHNQIESILVKEQLLSEIVEVSNNSISNQLSSANWFLAILAIVLAFLGFFLGIYIEKQKNKVEKIARIIEAKKKHVLEIAESTRKLDEKITNNVEGLYQRLRVEETKALLDRLICEPFDISNIITLLLARDLEIDGYTKLKEAYQIFLSHKGQAGYDNQSNISFAKKQLEYVVLFFQHYSYQSLKDDEIRPYIIQYYGNCFAIAFKRDMIKSTIDLCKALSDTDSTFNKEQVLAAYLKALNKSPFKELSDIKNLLLQNIIPQIILEKAVESCKKDGVELVLFQESTQLDDEKDNNIV